MNALRSTDRMHRAIRRLLRITATIATAALAITTPVASHAVPIAVDSGWSTFQFDGPGSPWHLVGLPGTAVSYEFTPSHPIELQITDTFFSGDRFEVFRFEVFNVGSSIGLTSNPTATGADATTFDAAFNDGDGRWSRGRFLLTPGAYSVSGTAAVSQFSEGGVGGIRLVTLESNLPLDASGMALAALSIGAIGATVRRRRET